MIEEVAGLRTILPLLKQQRLISAYSAAVILHRETGVAYWLGDRH
jgi:hypothetical protein